MKCQVLAVTAWMRRLPLGTQREFVPKILSKITCCAFFGDPNPWRIGATPTPFPTRIPWPRRTIPRKTAVSMWTTWTMAVKWGSPRILGVPINRWRPRMFKCGMGRTIGRWRGERATGKQCKGTALLLLSSTGTKTRPRWVACKYVFLVVTLTNLIFKSYYAYCNKKYSTRSPIYTQHQYLDYLFYIILVIYATRTVNCIYKSKCARFAITSETSQRGKILF